MTEKKITRRRALGVSASALTAALNVDARLALAVTGIEGAELGDAVPFSFDALQKIASERAMLPYVPVVVPSPDILDQITYDQYQRIRYRPEKSVQLQPDPSSLASAAIMMAISMRTPSRHSACRPEARQRG